MTKSPVTRGRVPPAKPKEIRPPTSAQVYDFLRAVRRERYTSLYELAFDAGAHQGALSALECPDVDRSRGEVVITKSLEEVKGILEVKETKTLKSRRVPLLRTTLEALRRHQVQNQRSGEKKRAVSCYGS